LDGTAVPFEHFRRAPHVIIEEHEIGESFEQVAIEVIELVLVIEREEHEQVDIAKDAMPNNGIKHGERHIEHVGWNDDEHGEFAVQVIHNEFAE
jgi:hypothetical protein